MGNSTTAVIFLAIVNVLMWGTMLSITMLNPSLSLDNMCYTSDGTLLAGTMTGNTENSTLVGNDVDDLPDSTQGSIQAGGSTGFITDIFNNIVGWFTNINKGLKYAIAIVNAPSNVLGCIGLPQQLSNVLGALWNIITLFVFVSYWWWRD